jgi:hypothetical protein
MFVFRTTEGIVIGPFPSYDATKAWASRSIWANRIDDIYTVLPPREDMIAARNQYVYPGLRAAC